VRLALADAFDFGSVQAVDLGAALAAFLREHAIPNYRWVDATHNIR
jgi:hypothetical protein